jgi:hypothetical protein
MSANSGVHTRPGGLGGGGLAEGQGEPLHEAAEVDVIIAAVLPLEVTRQQRHERRLRRGPKRRVRRQK